MSTPVSKRLIVHGDEIHDLATGLKWKSCLVGQTLSDARCTQSASELSWNEAHKITQDTPGDWRLPKLEDLETILDSSGEGGQFPKPFSICETGQIWTASPGFPVNDVAAVLDLSDGRIWGTGKGAPRNFLMVSGEISLDY